MQMWINFGVYISGKKCKGGNIQSLSELHARTHIFIVARKRCSFGKAGTGESCSPEKENVICFLQQTRSISSFKQEPLCIQLI